MDQTFKLDFIQGHLYSSACNSLLVALKSVKKDIKGECIKRESNDDVLKVLDQLQYAYKINVNSLYGVLSFK